MGLLDVEAAFGLLVTEGVVVIEEEEIVSIGFSSGRSAEIVEFAVWVRAVETRGSGVDVKMYVFLSFRLFLLSANVDVDRTDRPDPSPPSAF